MIPVKRYNQIQFYLCAAFLIALPNAPDHIKVGSLILFISIILSVFQFKHFKAHWKNYSWLLLVLPIWFLVKLLGFFPAEDDAMAWRSVFLKLPFLFFPLIFLSWSPEKQLRDQLLNVFFYACLIAVGVNFFYAIVRVYVFKDLVYLTYSKLSPSIDPAYLGMYLNFAFSIGVLKLKQRSFKSVRIYSSLSLMAIFILLLLSRNAILFLGFNILFLSFMLLRSKKWTQFFSLMLVLLFVSGLVSQNDRVRTRMKSALDFFNLDKEEYVTNSMGLRFLVWENSIEVINSNLGFGVGSGFEREELSEKFEEKGLDKPQREYYNTHNQFLQTALAHGIPGILLILVCFIAPFAMSSIPDYRIFLWFLTLCFVSFFTESMLERQAGVFFFAFFYPLFVKRYD